MTPIVSDARPLSISRGRVVVVDATDYDWLAGFRWAFTESKRGRRGYAAHFKCVNNTIRMTYMHRMIMDAPTGVAVDHINGDTLDNRRCNLRLCTTQQNSQNTGPSPTNTSGYKGVSWHKQRQRWTARISMPAGHYKHLGLFDTREQAARAYNDAAVQAHGEFARLNEIVRESHATAAASTHPLCAPMR